MAITGQQSHPKVGEGDRLRKGERYIQYIDKKREGGAEVQTVWDQRWRERHWRLKETLENKDKGLKEEERNTDSKRSKRERDRVRQKDTKWQRNIEKQNERKNIKRYREKNWSDTQREKCVEIKQSEQDRQGRLSHKQRLRSWQKMTATQREKKVKSETDRQESSEERAWSYLPSAVGFTKCYIRNDHWKQSTQWINSLNCIL